MTALAQAPTIRRRVVAAWAAWDWGGAAFNAVITTFVFTVYLTGDRFVASDRPARIRRVRLGQVGAVERSRARPRDRGPRRRRARPRARPAGGCDGSPSPRRGRGNGRGGRRDARDVVRHRRAGMVRPRRHAGLRRHRRVRDRERQLQRDAAHDLHAPHDRPRQRRGLGVRLPRRHRAAARPLRDPHPAGPAAARRDGRRRPRHPHLRLVCAVWTAVFAVPVLLAVPDCRRRRGCPGTGCSPPIASSSATSPCCGAPTATCSASSSPAPSSVTASRVSSPSAR